MNHLEIVLHFLLEDCVVKDDSTSGVKTCEDLLVAAPLELGDGTSLRLHTRHAFPTFAISWTFSGKLFALPHNDEPFLSTAGNDSPLWVVLDRDDLVVVDLVFE